MGSDSDSRYNSVMRQLLKSEEIFNANEEIPYWFNARIENVCYYPVQDMVHIGTKLRNNCLNQRLKFGQHPVTFDHLQPTDRQNFDSVLNICSENVINLLSTVPDSRGTIMYLR